MKWDLIPEKSGVIGQMENMEVIGLMAAIGVPALFWAWRQSVMVAELLRMHKRPDDHGFGTERTNSLLRTQQAAQSTMHTEYINTTKTLTHAMKELTHYIIIAYRNQNGGKDPAPYVRGRENV